MCPKATFLHLSDFHFRKENEWDYQHVFNHFKEDINSWQIRKNERIDGILITGDIAYSGQPDEYELAFDKIKEIMAITGVKMENIFLVPGNHDVDRNEITKPEEETTRSILESKSNVNEYFRRYGDYKIFLDKFKSYSQFLNKMGNTNIWETNEDGKIKPWYSIRTQIPINGIFFRIVGLTSSLFISKNEDLFGKIHVSARQIQEGLNPIKGDEFVIMLAHHPLDWFYPEEKTLLQALIGHHKRAIFLHGHSHQYQIEHRSLFDSHLKCVAAGSVYSRSDNSNRYHILQIDLNSNKLTLWPRKWYPDREWREDNDWKELDDDQSCAVELPRIVPIVEMPPQIVSEISNPYSLNNKQLSFSDFPDNILCQTADKDGKIDISVVVGSGRFKEADHVSYGTDCIGIPEITTLLNHTPKTYVSSSLDIDIFNTEDMKDKNLLLLGSGKVNYVTMKLLERFKGTLGFQFNHPEYTTLNSSSSGKLYTDGDQDDWGLGILALMRNPWAADAKKQRIIILIAGFHPLGSMAANKLLCDFIDNPGERENNRVDKSIPMKIIRGRRIGFSQYLDRISDVIENPIRNRTYIGKLKEKPEIVE
jgi:predicted phosphodiesterase